MPTIDKDAQEILTATYRGADYRGDTLNSAADFSDKLHACRAIVKAARTMRRNAEKRCNGIERYDTAARRVLASWTDADDARADKSDARAVAAIRGALATLYGPDWGARFTLETQGDPRGAIVRLHRTPDRNAQVWAA